MPNPIQLIGNILRCDDVTVGLVPEIQFYPRLKTPLQGHLVDGDGPFRLAILTVHGAVIMIGRIKMGTVVGA